MKILTALAFGCPLY